MRAERPGRRVRVVLRNAVRSRVAQRKVRQELDRRGPLAPGRFQVAVYFPDYPVNLYQVRQWYEPLRELARRVDVVVVARYATTARTLLAECPVPVVLAPTIATVEDLLAEHPVRVVLYVNQNMRNFSALRFRTPLHVFISHGESDKDYMASNQIRAYDVALVAGPAAVDRLRRHLRGYDADARTIRIGRPQVDVDHGPSPLVADGRTVVLYAPTWEGDRPTMRYGSVVSHGPALVDALLADPRFRVVFRPHPRTGVVDPEAAAAVRHIGRRIEAANRADPGAGHLWDRGTPFGWHLRACDVCVTDVSAVAYDWLATGAPLVVTRPASPEALLGDGALVRRLPLLDAEASSSVPRLVLDLLATGGGTAYRDLVEHYYGDVSPGASMRRFVDAVADLVELRQAELDEAAGQP